MTLRGLLSVSALILGPAVGLSQTVVSYYNFNSLTNGAAVSFPISPSAGTGSLTSNFNQSGASGVTAFAGTTTNALNGDPAGQSLALQGGSTGTNNNGKYIQIAASTAGLSGISVTFATQKSGTSGFSSNQFQYSTDGTTFTNFGSAYNPGTSFATQSFDLSSISGLDDNTAAAFRIVFGGATAQSGNNRIDNIQVVGLNPVPEPAGLIAATTALFAAGAAARRRADRASAA